MKTMLLNSSDLFSSGHVQAVVPVTTSVRISLSERVASSVDKIPLPRKVNSGDKQLWNQHLSFYCWLVVCG